MNDNNEVENLVKSKALFFISKLDDARWNAVNIEELNYYAVKMEPEEKVLSHWITYVSDRQMPYERIWTLGGYVYSYIVLKWKGLACINENERVKEINNLFVDLIKEAKSEDGKYKISVEYDGKNELLNKEGYESKQTIDFTSRYYKEDIKRIYLTLMILSQKYESSLFTYIKKMSENANCIKEKAKFIIFAMYLLTYKVSPIDKSYDKKNETDGLSGFEELIKSKDSTKICYESDYKIVCDNIDSFKKNPNEYLEEFDGLNKKKDKFLKSSPRFNSTKRLWCSIRDYMKVSNYKDYFKECLSELSSEEVEQFREETLKYIELPGDVWNNNSKFRRCILDNDTDEKVPLAYILRNDYEKHNTVWENCKAYPVKFDVSFDLAMRMCDKNKCKYCLLGEKNIAKDLCINDNKKLCPLIMIYCGYEYNCNGKEQCLFKDFLFNEK